MINFKGILQLDCLVDQPEVVLHQPVVLFEVGVWRVVSHAPAGLGLSPSCPALPCPQYLPYYKLQSFSQ
eukprot:1139848-Pelagomonas_calceolata.AAC.9